jgi:hypothetical protein
MFREEYKKEMAEFTPSEELVNRVKTASRKPGTALLRPAAALAAAAVCFVIFGGNLFTKNNQTEESANNLFSLKAYAMERKEDGGYELNEVDFLSRRDATGGYDDGQNIYLNVGLKCEGNNIKNVEFSTDEGFFAKQYIDKTKPGWESGVSTLYIGNADGSHSIAMFGDKFDIAGNKLTLDKDITNGDLLIFVGQEKVQFKDSVTIRALATFNDGTTNERTLTIDLSAPSLVIGKTYTPEEMEYLLLDGTDTGKIVVAFISEAENQGFTKVKVNSVTLKDYRENIWKITFDAIPEQIAGGDETLVTNITRNIQLSSYNENYKVVMVDTAGE